MWTGLPWLQAEREPKSNQGVQIPRALRWIEGVLRYTGFGACRYRWRKNRSKRDAVDAVGRRKI